MFRKLQKKTEGFTIIEVLIVLAIAGLILLIVFLAVPALQRNSRNTQRKNDVARVGGAVQEVLNNNNGSVAAVTSALVQTAVGTPAYYAVANITRSAAAPAAAPGTNATTTDTVVIYMGATCNGTTGNAIPGTTRQVAIVYTLEAAVQQCTSQ